MKRFCALPGSTYSASLHSFKEGYKTWLSSILLKGGKDLLPLRLALKPGRCTRPSKSLQRPQRQLHSNRGFCVDSLTISPAQDTLWQVPLWKPFRETGVIFPKPSFRV